MKNFITYLFFGLMTVSVGVAQDTQYSQFFQSKNYYNPAFVGLNKSLGGSVLVRSQWANTDASSLHSFVTSEIQLENISSAMGISIYYDNTNSGTYNKLGFDLNYNYRKKLNNHWGLTSGVMLGYGSITAKSESYVFGDQIGQDGSIGSSMENGAPINNRGFFDMGLGLLLKHTEKTMISLGVRHINFPQLSTLTNDKVTIDPLISFYASHRWRVSGGFQRPNEKNMFLEPSLLWFNQRSFNQLRIGGKLEIEMVKIGLFYRGWPSKLNGEYLKTDAMIFMAELQSNSFAMSYSYDWVIAPNRVSANSHEIMLGYILPEKNQTKSSSRRRGRR
ncbi:PorP/SprF family type IX secretion system membrane protein [Cyclobacteriaceae bacterium]|nr:PorP/SprF family type IX secretion system membrane protein [Cyclobacteriaceae bacterium]